MNVNTTGTAPFADLQVDFSGPNPVILQDNTDPYASEPSNERPVTD